MGRGSGPAKTKPICRSSEAERGGGQATGPSRPGRPWYSWARCPCYGTSGSVPRTALLHQTNPIWGWAEGRISAVWITSCAEFDAGEAVKKQSQFAGHGRDARGTHGRDAPATERLAASLRTRRLRQTKPISGRAKRRASAVQITSCGEWDAPAASEKQSQSCHCGLGISGTTPSNRRPPSAELSDCGLGDRPAASSMLRPIAPNKPNFHVTGWTPVALMGETPMLRNAWRRLAAPAFAGATFLRGDDIATNEPGTRQRPRGGL